MDHIQALKDYVKAGEQGTVVLCPSDGRILAVTVPTRSTGGGIGIEYFPVPRDEAFEAAKSLNQEYVYCSNSPSSGSRNRAGLRERSVQCRSSAL